MHATLSRRRFLVLGTRGAAVSLIVAGCSSVEPRTEEAPADLILFDPGAPVVVDASRLRSKSKNSPFDGRRLQGKVIGTWVGGRKVH